MSKLLNTELPEGILITTKRYTKKHKIQATYIYDNQNTFKSVVTRDFSLSGQWKHFEAVKALIEKISRTSDVLWLDNGWRVLAVTRIGDLDQYAYMIGV
tara:strand:+ start:580 stop:876 length:297 start_codon:yes stop_codon:yes gene_type:complete